MSTVLVLGTFDGLHQGHEDYFRQAKAYGDRLVVVIARDRTVLEVKGQLPRRGEDARRTAVEDHPLVDSAVLGREGGDKLEVISELRPDVIVLGYDQEAFTEGLEEKLRARGLNSHVVRAEPYQADVYKSSLLQGVTTDRVETEPVADWLPL